MSLRQSGEIGGQFGAGSSQLREISGQLAACRRQLAGVSSQSADSLHPCIATRGRGRQGLKFLTVEAFGKACKDLGWTGNYKRCHAMLDSAEVLNTRGTLCTSSSARKAVVEPSRKDVIFECLSDFHCQP